MFGPADNRISAEDRSQVYELLGFNRHGGTRVIPASLNLAVVMATGRLVELRDRASEEYRRRHGRLGLRGLTEYRVGVELVRDRSTLSLTGVTRGGPNHAGREVDRTRTIVGTIHTHPWDVGQSIGDVRNLIRSNDVLGGVVTPTGRIYLLIKHPDESNGDRSPFATELKVQGASLIEGPNIVRGIGWLGAVSASFDLPIRATRDAYIEAVCGRLGLLSYAGDVTDLALQRL